MFTFQVVKYVEFVAKTIATVQVRAQEYLIVLPQIVPLNID